MSHKPYSVYSPPFEVTSGGIRVMYGLYGALLLKGQIVHINGKYESDNFIAIYPEIVQGNPLGAKHVVRYILNEPGVMQTAGVSGPTEFDENDKLYVFSEIFNQKLRLDGSHKMFMPVLDMNLFHDQKKDRSKTAYFVGKGVNKNLHPKDSIEIDRTIAHDQQALADLLNECHTLYQYDMVSAMSEIARLCGCKVTLIQDKYTKSQYREYEPGLNGISFGMDEDVPLSVRGFRTHYSMMKREFLLKLDKFIKDTQKL